MSKQLLEFLRAETSHLEQAGLLHQPMVIDSPPGPSITLGNRELLNLTCGDYLGLSTHTDVKRAAKAAADTYGAGAGSSRMGGGTLPVHVELEQALTRFLQTEDSLVFPSGYHANTALFEALAGERDYIFCDDQAHPSLVDGIRLSRARVFPYRSNDMEHLEDRLKRSRAARFRLIVTDAVFPLRGTLANLRALYELCSRYDALAVVDDSQGIGVLGDGGRGTHEALGLRRPVDVVTGSFGYALGGAGGFVSGRAEVICWLRQKSRPFLMCGPLAPPLAGAAIKAVELCQAGDELRARLRENVAAMSEGLGKAGLNVVGGGHAVLSVMIGDALRTQRMADALFKDGVLTMGYCHPVVPEGTARIRLQLTAKHTQKALKSAVEAFERAREAAGVPAETKAK